MTIAEIDDKQFDTKLEKKTVVDVPKISERRTPSATAFFLQVAAAAQSITPWGFNPIRRDKELRSFWHSESWLASVVYSVSIRNASFAWHVIGTNPGKTPPKNTINAITTILKQSNRGKGWKDLILKTCIDLYSQDNGVFWEIIRNGKGQNAPVINFSHLDSARCCRTGNPQFPVIYTDRLGKEHILPHWRVRTIEELPSPIEDAYGLQYCAVSRALMAAEIISSISTYKLEKVSGNFTRSVDFVSGPTQNNIDDALALAEEQNLNKGQYRFSLPVIVPGIDPTSSLSHVHIDLASLPDNFDEDTSFKWYVAQLASAFGVDYQEIAPLMTGNLGSSQQSEIMHLKTRGKGPALIMGMFEDVINGLLPNNVEFKFLEQDIRSEREKAETKFTRVKARSMQIKSGELTSQAARELAVMDGDLPRWLKDEVDKAEVAQEQFNEENQRDEFGPSQVESGVDTEIDTRNKRITMSRVKEIQNMISENPFDVLRTWFKGSFGNPSGTVIAPVYAFRDTDLEPLVGQLATRWQTQRVRLVRQYDYHITLIHSPLADDLEFRSIAKIIDPTISDYPFEVTASQVSSFDTENGKAIILKIDSSPVLVNVQNTIYDMFRDRNIPLSDFSSPDQWIPHVTLAYIDSDVAFEEFNIDPIRLQVEFPRFTRTDHVTEN